MCREAFGSGQSWPRRHEADGGQEAYRRARPGGGVTKQLPSGSPLERFFFFFRLPAEEKEERAVCREAFGSGQSWPRRREADGGRICCLQKKRADQRSTRFRYCSRRV